MLFGLLGPVGLVELELERNSPRTVVAPTWLHQTWAERIAELGKYAALATWSQRIGSPEGVVGCVGRSELFIAAILGWISWTGSCCCEYVRATGCWLRTLWSAVSSDTNRGPYMLSFSPYIYVALAYASFSVILPHVGRKLLWSCTDGMLWKLPVRELRNKKTQRRLFFKMNDTCWIANYSANGL